MQKQPPCVTQTAKNTDSILIKDMGRIAHGVATGLIAPASAALARRTARALFEKRKAHADLVTAFNDAYCVGQAVTVDMGNGAIAETVTTSRAVLIDGNAKISLQGIDGHYSLTRVKVSQ